MELIADLLLTAGAMGVAFYCFVLSRRLTRFTDLEKGVGGAVAVLSAQVDDLNKAVVAAKEASATADTELRALTERADAVSRRLELHLASLHDLPESEIVQPEEPVTPPEPPVSAPPANPAVKSFFQSHRTSARGVA